MKVLVMYYSRMGHAAQVAGVLEKELVARNASVEVLRLHHEREPTLLGCATEARRGARPELIGLPKDVSGYDLVFLGFPTWGGRASSPANSMVAGVQNVSGKKCVLFSTSGFREGFVRGLNDVESSIKSLGGEVIDKQGFSLAERAKSNDRAVELVARVLGAG